MERKNLHVARARVRPERPVAVDDEARRKVSREVRARMREMTPVALLTPRWSAPQAFLEDLALDLAVGDPPVACRTLACRPLRGRSPVEAWNPLLRAMAELIEGMPAGRPIPVVCERRGFLHLAGRLLDEAHERNEVPAALLVHGVEHLPVEVLADLQEAWATYRQGAVDGPRSTLLLAGASATPALALSDLVTLDLTDFSRAESTATLLLRLGTVSLPELFRPVRFTGGVPALVHALGEGASRTGEVPRHSLDMIRAMGPVAEEVRAAVATALTSAPIAERFYALCDGSAQPFDPERDETLLLSGLARRARDPEKVELRAPAFAAVAR